MATYLGHQEDSSGNILLPTPHSMATQIEFGTKASQAYAKGAYVVFNNRLCKASKAIASGDTLAIGTNLVQCSIGSELNSHLQAPNGSEFYFDYKDGKPGFYPSASKVASEFVPFGGSEFPSICVKSSDAGHGQLYIDNATFSKYSKVVCTSASSYVTLWRASSVGGLSRELAGRGLTSWEYTLTSSDYATAYLGFVAAGSGHGWIHLE